MGLLCFAGLLCCVPMAMPQGHLVAFCTDVGIAPAHGAAMLSVLLGIRLCQPPVLGLAGRPDRGLRTVLAGSVVPDHGDRPAFLLTQNEAGLFAVAAIFGFGFSGIIPAYVVAIRELFPAARGVVAGADAAAVHRLGGMALGGWLAGMIYDWAGFYAIAFATGIAFNAAHILVIGSLVLRGSRVASRPFADAVASSARSH